MGVLENAHREIIREGNHIIALFDGYHHTTNGAYRKEGQRASSIDDFKYNWSWEAIMPVCKKFCTLDPLTFDNERHYRERRDDLNDRVTRYDINVVYPALRDNIEWYNKQKKK